MAGITKINATHSASTDDELVKECETTTGRRDCDDAINWTEPVKGIPISPPEDTIAILVDVRGRRGAIRIFKKSDKEYVDGVGTERSGNLVIVPWDPCWYFQAAGSLLVGYVVLKRPA